MAARYIGRKPIRLATGEILKTNDTTERITDEQAKVLKQFEPVTKTKDFKKKYKESDDE
jgi:hypothetical protein